MMDSRLIPKTVLAQCTDGSEKVIGQAIDTAFAFGIDLGDRVSKGVMETYRVRRSMKNIHKVKKGKRYIHRFEYSSDGVLLEMVGRILTNE